MRIDPNTLRPGSPLAVRIAAALARDAAERTLRRGPVLGVSIAAPQKAVGVGCALEPPRASQKHKNLASGQIWSPGAHSPESWSREEDLHRAVWVMIQSEARADVVIFHPANGGARSKAEAGRMKAQGVVAGIPDLIVIVAGRAHGLELKTQHGRISPAQKRMAEMFQCAGAEYDVARSVAGARMILARWGAIDDSRSAP